MKVFNFKNIFIFFLITSLLIIFISIKLFFLSDCFTVKIFSAYKSFGYNHLKQCYSKNYLERNIKKLSKDFPIIFEFLRKQKRNYFGSTDQDLLTILNIDNMQNTRDNIENYKYTK